MARVPGKCSVCGQITQVNDEKESGHCSQCGAAVQVQECIQLLQSSGGVVSHAAPPAPAAVDQEEVTRRREERERAREAEIRLKEKQLDAELKAKAQREKEEAQRREQERLRKEREKQISQTIENMFQFCATEQDFLQLRSKIMERNYSESEKAKLLEELDDATQERLKDTLKKAKSWEESQESPLSTLGTGIAVIVLCLIVRHFFPTAGTILLVVMIAGLVINFVERFDKKKQAENKAAAELIDQYRQLGYKI